MDFMMDNPETSISFTKTSFFVFKLVSLIFDTDIFLFHPTKNEGFGAEPHKKRAVWHAPLWISLEKRGIGVVPVRLKRVCV